MAPITIVGSGLAGWTLARELRKRDPDTPIALVTADAGDFYAKPSLSNALAAGRSADQLVTTAAPKMAAQVGVELHVRRRVLSIDRGAHALRTDAGELAYSRLVLALGADPIRLPIEGDAAADVLSVNDLDDYRRLRARLSQQPREVAILGAGLIGCEFANDLQLGGHRVTVLDPSPRPLAALLPAPAGEALAQRLQAAGVRWRFGDAVVEVAREAGRLRLRTRTGAVLTADAVLSAVGLRPRTALAAGAGLAVQRGIVVDAFGASSDPDVFALGDCAQYEAGVMPYVMPIMAAARSIAATLLGSPEPIRFGAMPIAVKTPALPIAVVPAPAAGDGTWHNVGDATGVRMRYEASDGTLRGFVVAGDCYGERQALARALDIAPRATAEAA